MKKLLESVCASAKMPGPQRMTTTDGLAKKAINHARENPNFLKMYIFFQATNKSFQNYPKCRPIQEPCYQNYKKMCENYGDDAMDYQEYEFWFMRFSSGEFDMDYDWRLAPRNRSFTDLPIDALELIAEHLLMYDRKVSKSLREFIKKQVFDCTDIGVTFGDDLILVSYGEEEILYAKNDKAVKTFEKEYEVLGAPILYEDDSEVCDDLAYVLKNPKLQLYYFRFSFLGWWYKAGVLSTFLTKFEYALKSLKHQISVKKLNLQPEYPDDVLAILPNLKPGYLETIEINNEFIPSDWKSDENPRKVEQIMQLDQWKQAKELILLDSLHLFPGEVLLQFKKYCIQTSNRCQLTRFGMVSMFQIFVASSVFEYCYLWMQNPSDDDYSIDFIGVPGPLTPGYRSVRHLMIPNTEKLLVFKESTLGYIVIQKKTRDDVQ